MNPPYNERILPFPWHFIISRSSVYVLFPGHLVCIILISLFAMTYLQNLNYLEKIKESRKK